MPTMDGKKSGPEPLPIPTSAQPTRPSPARAATLAAYQISKSRASSQPAGERLPVFGSSPGSGRDSPLSSGNGGAYGVIGGSRTPSRFGSGNLPAPGPATRANSFSVAEGGLSHRTASYSNRTLPPHQEERVSRSHSKSPYPTFSPTSSLSGSPRPGAEPHLHSPPRAEANVSRSRSQSLAGGPKMTATERNHMMPMSALADTGAFPRGYDNQWSTSRPFALGMPTLSGRNAPTSTGSPEPSRWAESSTWSTTGGSSRSALGSSVSRAAAQSRSGQRVVSTGQAPPQSTVIGGFEPHSTGHQSGSSSRRHSISVVSGPNGRRDVFGEVGGGMSTVTSPPGRGLGRSAIPDEDLWPQELNNALSLEIDSNRRRGIDIEQRDGRVVPFSQSLPRIEPIGQRNSGLRASIGHGDPFSADYRRPSPGRPEQSASAMAAFDASRSQYEGAMVPWVGGGGGLPGPGMRDAMGYSNYRGQEHEYQPDGRVYYPPQVGSYPGGPYQGRPQYQDPNLQYRHPQYYNGHQDGYQQQRFHQAPAQYSSGFSPAAQPFQPGAQYQQQRHHSPNHTSPDPNSPSAFSQLSLADLGKGIPLVSIAPTTSLYVVSFKAGRRDVYYCPDPTLLISNGDWVVVEADRGSDLGTVVYDQLSAAEIREWQEKHASATLMSGVQVHQPPGMALVLRATPPKQKPKVLSGGLVGLDLDTLLAGVGPGGQSEQTPPPSHRVPLLKEIMPKRIFAKSAQGPEDQARMNDKVKDEEDALAICREKAAHRGLAMSIVDAEYQWDRRKLTFYFKADRRVDFRDLTKENFRIFKSRIWMSMVPKDDPRN